MQRFTRTVSMALGASVLALGFSGFASAGTDNDPYLKKVAVSYSDLDLGRVAHARHLYSRISSAANEVCRSPFGITTRTKRASEDKCVAKAINDAVFSVSNANLTSVYMARAGKRSMLASSR